MFCGFRGVIVLVCYMACGFICTHNFFGYFMVAMVCLSFIISSGWVVLGPVEALRVLAFESVHPMCFVLFECVLNLFGSICSVGFYDL